MDITLLWFFSSRGFFIHYCWLKILASKTLWSVSQLK